MSDLPKAIYGSPDRPLRIGDLEIPCYVLDDDRRVLALAGMLRALDMKPGTAGRGQGDRLAKFVGTKGVEPFVSAELSNMIRNPILFQAPSGGRGSYGYEATILADLCDAVLAARKAGALHRQQQHIAERCEILVRGFARVGIIALVDEATGFQQVRSRRALEKILDEFISKELIKWAKTFPDEFYEQMFRLKGWQYIPFSVRRPAYIGHVTNDIVYNRLAPGVLAELRRLNPRTEAGHRKARHHQWLTEDVGHPRLREHLAAVIALMRASGSWDQFHRMLDRALPRYGSTIELPFEEDV